MMDKDKTACFTGYRPEKFSFSLTIENIFYQSLRARLLFAIEEAVQQGITSFLYGGALGFDIVAAEAVLLYREKSQQPIQLHCALPFENQHMRWSIHWKNRYEQLQRKVDDRVVLYPSYQRGCYHARNRYMVDHSALLIAYYDGKPGGSGSTCRYARHKNVPIVNLAEDMEEWL